MMAAGSADERGAIYTRSEVVAFILDLIGYTADRPLQHMRLLEPSFGDADFLVPAIDRLLAAFEASGDLTSPVLALKDAVRGVELHHETFAKTRGLVAEKLREWGVSQSEAKTLAGHWLVQGDFLLWDPDIAFTHVVGNPPYVRQELIPDVLMSEYRRRFRSIYDRADLYVPFIEQGLAVLAPKGQLGYICADRWMKNRYGAPLRSLISEQYHLSTYVDMFDTPAFHSEVTAYPAIMVLVNDSGTTTRVAHRPEIEAGNLSQLTLALRDGRPHQSVATVENAVNGSEPWILDSADQLAVVRRLEAKFSPIEEVGCKVGIGVATGADRVFIGKYDEMDVEPQRKLPLAMSRDLVTGKVVWCGHGVLNPFEDDGSLAPLSEYPKFAAYLGKHATEIRSRHVSKKNPDGWYRTIDRIYRPLTYKPKLLFPDIKGEANVVFEEGKLYPHHNLYVLTSEEWDLRALQAIMLSAVARLFVATYCTKMRGGFLRFQAQYVRRIRLPKWEAVPAKLQKRLTHAGKSGDRRECNAAAALVYGLSASEQELIGMGD
ncbi:MAG: modification methylase PaeR7I [Hyphomicrobiales bacterium]|nr:MAG: modification methylase PaeR7I [Hyphomicrobiales bacterium]